MKTVKLITCNDAMKAHILQGALENEGIESILHNENFSTLYKSCVSSIAGVDILVADEDYEKAVQVLRQNQSWPEELTLCPYCGSSDIKFVLRKGHKLRAVGAAVLSMLAAAPPGDNHWEYTYYKHNEKEKTSINRSFVSWGSVFFCCQSRYVISEKSFHEQGHQGSSSHSGCGIGKESYGVSYCLSLAWFWRTCQDVD